MIYQEIQEQFENCSERWVWESCTVSKKASKGHIFKRKNCQQRALWTINVKTGADTITAKGTNAKRLPSAQLAYYTSEHPGWPCFPLPPSLPFQKCQRGDAAPAQNPSTALSLANCGVLLRGYMSAQAVTVSVRITTCLLAAIGPHHLCSIKQPAAGSRVDCPGAATVRFWVSVYNRCLCTNSPGLSLSFPPCVGVEERGSCPL